MAVNKPVGDKARKGAVKKRAQFKTALGGATAWTKRNKTSDEFMAANEPAKKKTAARKFKGLRREKVGSYVNDDRSPLLDLITCISCRDSMRLERVDPDGEGNDLVRYRCRLCGCTEVLRLFRRSR